MISYKEAYQVWYICSFSTLVSCQTETSSFARLLLQFNVDFLFTFLVSMHHHYDLRSKTYKYFILLDTLKIKQD